GGPSPRRALSVLFVGAEKGTALDLKGQLRKTRDAISRARYGHSILMTGVFNVTLQQLLMNLKQRSPDVLHLSVKQQGGKIKMHDEQGRLTPVAADQLADLLVMCQQTLRLVILDTCYSLPQAKRVVAQVDCAIGVAS